MEHAEMKSLESLGFTGKQIQDIQQIQMIDHGLFVVSGIAGQGRTKTSEAIFSHLVNRKRHKGGRPLRALTVQDYPRPIPGTYEIRRTAPFGDDEMRFTLKKALACDPDLLLVDEVCGPQSADGIRELVHSGHMVIGVIHAAGALAIPRRLVGMGMGEKAPFQKDFLSGLLYQRLIPKLCDDCSIPFSEDIKTNYYPEVLARLRNAAPGRDLSGIRVRNQNSCEHCRSGSMGRTVVAEVVPVTDPLLAAFEEGGEQRAHECFVSNGGMTIMSHAIEKVLAGEVDPVDAEYHLGVFS